VAIHNEPSGPATMASASPVPNWVKPSGIAAAPISSPAAGVLSGRPWSS